MKTAWRTIAAGGVLGLGIAITITAQEQPAAPVAAQEQPAPATTQEQPAAPAKAENPLSFLPETVATVDDRAITRAELLEEAKPFINMVKARQDGKTISEEQWRDLAKEVTEGLIEKNILLALAAADGLRPDAKRGDEEYRKILAEIPEEQIKTVIAQQGITMAELKEKLAVASAIQDWVEAFATKIPVSDEEVATFYKDHPERFTSEESVEASHILVRPKELSEEEEEKLSPEEQTAKRAQAKTEAKAKAEGLLKRLQAGEDFAALAEAESDCPSGKRNHGSLGEFGRGQMVKPFDDSVFALETGATSGLVETDFGYHIIKKTKHTPERVIPMAEVQEPLKGELQKRSVGEKIKALLDAEKLKRKVKILI